MTELNEKGLEAMVVELRHHVYAPDEEFRRIATDTARAYLSHTTPTDAEVAEMVKQLRSLSRAEHSDLSIGEDAAALIERLAGRVPEGWKMVPMEPTREMLHEIKGAMPVEVDYFLKDGTLHAEITPESKCVSPASVYRAMLSASPPFLKEEQKP